MSNKYLKLFVTLLLLVIFGCNGIKIEPLTLERMDNNTSLLKLNGYYFNLFQSDVEAIDIIFLYQNGVLLDGLSPDLADLSAAEEEFKSGDFVNEFAFENASAWGIYKLEGNTITIEQWFSGNGCCEPIVVSGTILSDSSFQINNQKFDFKPFSPKPDSTNTFIN